MITLLYVLQMHSLTIQIEMRVKLKSKEKFTFFSSANAVGNEIATFAARVIRDRERDMYAM
jgi:hypothetical protein